MSTSLVTKIGAVGNQATTNILSSMKSAMANANGNNYIDNPPWTLPDPWVTGTVFGGGWFVVNSQNNVYFADPGTPGGRTSGAIEPTTTTSTGQYDSADTSGIYWHYFGPANALKPTLKKNSTITPSSSTSVMDGFYAYYADTTTLSALGLTKAITLSATTNTVDLLGGTPFYFSLTGCTVPAATTPFTYPGGTVAYPTTLTVGAVAAGSIPIPTSNFWSPYLSAFIYVLSQVSGTPNGAGVYNIALDRSSAGSSNFPITNQSYPMYDMLGKNSASSDSIPSISLGCGVARFETSAKWLAVSKSAGYQSGNSAYYGVLVTVDGKLVSLTGITPPLGTNRPVVLFNLAAVKTADSCVVEIMFQQATAESLGITFYVERDDYVQPLTRNGLTLALEGDSTTEGGFGMPYYKYMTNALMAARMLGFDQFYTSACGGTKLTSANPGGSSYLDRLPGIIAMKPNVLAVMGNHNDVGVAEATFKNAMRQYINTFTQALPNSYLFWTGPRMLRDESYASQATTENWVREVIQNEYANNPRVVFVPILTYPTGNALGGGWYPNGTVAPAGKYFTPSSVNGDGHAIAGETYMVITRLVNVIRGYINGQTT
jgi:hypothetical protein